VPVIFASTVTNWASVPGTVQVTILTTAFLTPKSPTGRIISNRPKHHKHMGAPLACVFNRGCRSATPTIRPNILLLLAQLQPAASRVLIVNFFISCFGRAFRRTQNPLSRWRLPFVSAFVGRHYCQPVAIMIGVRFDTTRDRQRLCNFSPNACQSLCRRCVFRLNVVVLEMSYMY